MARLLLGVSGGIAAYKSLELVRLATAAGHAVRVIQTPTSRRFVGAASFEALTGAPVLSSEFERDPARGVFPGDSAPSHDPLSHLALAENADAFLVAPASANTLAKLAHGLADNLLTSAALAARCPQLVAPAMNGHMYLHAATRANIDLLRARGVVVVEPGSGRLASHGERGVGRLAEPLTLLAAIEAVLPGRPRPEGGEGGPDASWAGVRVLVSAGGTREPIDSVRFIGNRSSGRMGLALAADARRRGAAVTVVAANVSLEPPAGARWVAVQTAAELERACTDAFPDCDVLLMAAAVADFRPAQALAGKIEKVGREQLELTLELTPDILAGLAARRRRGQVLVGFAAEHGQRAFARAREKLIAKGLDAVVVNDIARGDIGFEAPDNEVTIVTASGEQHLELQSKQRIAAQVLDAVERMRVPGGRGGVLK